MRRFHFMPKLYLVRHAKPAATWSEDPDPGLDSIGVSQAERTAHALQARTPALPILTSPLRRCRETAVPLERAWQRRAEIFMPVAEIPSPPLPLHERHTWLRQAMQGTWAQMQQNAPAGSPDFLAWRANVIDSVQQLAAPAVIYTHYIAINVVVGAARGSDNVVCFRPDHASVTVVETDTNGIRLIELGAEAETLVLTRN
jgi:broad specificity phosphatase PhoE